MSRPLKIFVVDDDRDAAEGLGEVLEMFGHQVTLAFDGESAVQIFKEQDFDVSLMDVMMPGMNGVESFLEIRKIKPDAKVFMMTGFSVQQLLTQAI
nr:response regulator [Kiloniellales bacterium]